jgi:hypothetical protein
MRSAFVRATGHIGCDALATVERAGVIRWLIVILLALVLFSALRPWLEKFGLGRLPGDFRFRFAGRDWHIPLASSVVLSLIAMLIAHLF